VRGVFGEHQLRDGQTGQIRHSRLFVSDRAKSSRIRTPHFCQNAGPHYQCLVRPEAPRGGVFGEHSKQERIHRADPTDEIISLRVHDFHQFSLQEELPSASLPQARGRLPIACAA